MRYTLFIILFFVAFRGWGAARFTVGSGSGSLVLISMSGHSPGDTAAVIAGSYSSVDFSNLIGIIVVQNTTVVHWTGNINLSHDSLLQILGNTVPGTTYGFVCTTAGSAFLWSGTTYGLRMWNVDFQGVDVCFDLSSTVTRYDTVHDNSMLLRNSTFGNIRANNCGQLMQGTFASIDSVINVADSNTFINLSMDAIQGMGYAISYVGCFRLFVNGATFSGDMPGAHGDVGYVFIVGNYRLKNIERTGGFGYISRIVTASLHSTPLTSYMYNIIDYGSYHYGTVDVRCGNSFGGEAYLGQKSLTGGDIDISNITAGFKQDTSLDYTTATLVVGNMLGWQAHMHNVFGFNLRDVQGGGHPLVQVNTADPLDTANNIYWPTANRNLIDSTITWMPLASPLLPLNSGGADESSVSSADINGVPWSGTFGRGAVKFFNGVVPSLKRRVRVLAGH